MVRLLQTMHPFTDIHFTKFSATGNDFILIDNRKIGLSGEDVKLFREICQRRMSVGADGVLLIDDCSETDFELRYYNADGSETECGNGARSAAYFAFNSGIAGRKMSFMFGHDVYEAEVDGKFVKLQTPPARDLKESVGILQEDFLEEGGSVNMGVPHYVLFGKNVADLDVLTLGRKYRYHEHFKPEATNVNFVEIWSENEIFVRTYERGVENETMSCGTGSVASAIFAHLKKNVQFPVTVRAQGGTLFVHTTEGGNRFYLKGEVKPVYEGKLISVSNLKNS